MLIAILGLGDCRKSKNCTGQIVIKKIINRLIGLLFQGAKSIVWQVKLSQRVLRINLSNSYY